MKPKGIFLIILIASLPTIASLFVHNHFWLFLGLSQTAETTCKVNQALIPTFGKISEFIVGRFIIIRRIVGFGVHH
jgi:hypothetical protein